MLALDIHTGEEKWRVDSGVFGTWLSYSEEHDILIQGGRPGGGKRMPGDEPGDRISAYRGRDGSLSWKKGLDGYRGPLAIGGDTLYLPAPGRSREGAGALNLLTGKRKMRKQPHTGSIKEWNYTRYYGCGAHNVSEHLITFRAGAAGFLDMENDSGIGIFSGFRSGCTDNLIAADGVLSAPDYTRTCTCSFAHQTSLGLIHMPHDKNIEAWTRYSAAAPDPEGFALNFGAPGRRVDIEGNGLIWYDEPGATRRHPSVILENEDGIDWVAASFREMEGKIEVDDLLDGVYEIRLHFAELDESAAPEDRVFVVVVGGEEVLTDFDIVREAEGALRGVVRSFYTESEGNAIEIELRGKDRSRLDPAINGIELRKINDNYSQTAILSD